MNKTGLAQLFAIVFLFLSLALCRESVAALGEPADSVAADRRELSAVQKSTTQTGGITVQEVSTPGVTVREYISPDGIVFAVAWNGFARPDLSVLLGSYANEYEKTRRQTPVTPGRRQSRIKTGNIVVETWGHMRDLHGRAYVPALVPQGVHIDEIK